MEKLFPFQRDAAIGIINRLENYQGCILADGVGLGKTFTALAVIKYYELCHKKVLVLCPKKLRENWTSYKGNLTTNELAEDSLHYDVFNHTDLTRESGKSGDIDLKQVNWGGFDLVVIDESHNFRNDGTRRYQELMDRILRQGISSKVLMLSATPLNNKFNDLKNQLALTCMGDFESLQQKLNIKTNIKSIFKKAEAGFKEWIELPIAERKEHKIHNILGSDFYQLLNGLTIARSRKHIQEFYHDPNIGQFPKHRPLISHHIPITNHVGFAYIEEKLLDMEMAAYVLGNYVKPSQSSSKLPDYRQLHILKLVIINLLKRLESSIYAFKLTLEKLQNQIQDSLDQVNEFQKHYKALEKPLNIVPNVDVITDEDEEWQDLDDLIDKNKKNDLNTIDDMSWKGDLEKDKQIIQNLLKSLEQIDAEKDEKLQHLKNIMIEKIHAPFNPDNKKIIIFTAFADTADYLYQYLAPFFQKEFGLHTAKISGSSNQSTLNNTKYSMQDLLTLFSPKSKQKAQILPNEKREIDILIATDCISEGQNLQDCDYLINFDIPWNPVRIIQRFGRIDRIGSTNKEIQLVNYWPDMELDKYINLHSRVEEKINATSMTSAGENILDDQMNIDYRAEQLKSLKNGVLENDGTNISITDLGLDDFRMDLFNYIDQNLHSIKMPKGVHCVVPELPEEGLNAGVIFALKSRQPQDPEYNNPNQFYPYYVFYVQDDGTIIHDHTKDHTQIIALLNKACSACIRKTQPIPHAYESFNRRTKDGHDMQQYSKLLNKAIQRIQKSQEIQEIDNLFANKKTSNSNHKPTLNDFELICFIVIERENI